MIGALTTIMMPKGKLVPVQLRDPLGWLGLILIGGSFVVINEETPFPGLWAIPSTLGTALILVSAGPRSWIGSVLTFRLLVFCGLISYSLYLWHQPLLALYRVQVGDQADVFGLGLMILTSVLMGWISWRYVERPFRNRSFMTRASVLLSTVAGLGIIGAVGTIFVVSQGMVKRYPEHLRPLMAVSLAERAAYVRTQYNGEVRDRKFSEDVPRVLLIGDSFSQDLYNAISESQAFAGFQISADYIAVRCQFRLDGTAAEVAIAPGDVSRCAAFDNRINDFTLSRARKADVVIVAFLWQEWSAKQLSQTLERLNLRAATQVIVIGSKYFFTPGMRRLETMTVQDLTDFRAALEPSTAAVNAILARASIEAQFVDVMDLFCETEDECRVFTPHGDIISYDKRHLTQEGARYFGKLMFSSGGPLSRFGHNQVVE